MIETILRVLPQTTNIVVVYWHLPLEQFWLAEMRRSSALHEPGDLELVSTICRFRMLKRCAALPRVQQSFSPASFVDAAGVPHREERAMVSSTTLPMRHVWAPRHPMGRGIVGGPLMSLDELSRNTAKVAVRILRGERTGDIKIPPQRTGSPPIRLAGT